MLSSIVTVSSLLAIMLSMNCLSVNHYPFTKSRRVASAVVAASNTYTNGNRPMVRADLRSNCVFNGTEAFAD